MIFYYNIAWLEKKVHRIFCSPQLHRKKFADFLKKGAFFLVFIEKLMYINQ